MSLPTSSWLALAPLITVAAGALAVMLLDAFADEEGDRAILPSVVLLTAAIWAGIAGYGDVSVAQGPEWVKPYLALDAFSQLIFLIISVGSVCGTLLAGGYLREHELERGDFYSMLLWCVFGAMVLASASDLISVFIGLEMMSLATYCLVAFRLGNRRSIEAATKYFLLGSFAGAIFLFGCALLYGAAGRTDLRGIAQAVRSGAAEPSLVVLAALLLLAGLAFKISAVPFHMWTPDAYQGAITPVTALMSVVVKTAAFALLLRLLSGVLGDSRSSDGVSGWPPLLAALSVATMVYGNIAAIYQSNLKRMLAYSSIAHAGYLLIGAAAMFRAGPTAVSAILYYLMAYTVSNLLTFGSLIALGRKGKESVSYQDIAGAGFRHPLASLAFAIGVLSLMGLPPTAGFFAKYYIFMSALQTGGGMVWLVVVGALASVVAAFYYLRVIVYLYMTPPEPGAPTAEVMRSAYLVVALLVCVYFVLMMGITPSRYLELALGAAAMAV